MSRDPEFQAPRGKGKTPTPFFSWRVGFSPLFYAVVAYFFFLTFLFRDVMFTGGLTVINVMPMYCVTAGCLIVYLMQQVLKD